ncbi:hypothetical protein [Sorangium sp. So ce542]|uniref:hypothetical protein n=1 Tax=Sorangium sp. So ce542 TaxID=3133316 RepID=UPI003F63BF62
MRSSEVRKWLGLYFLITTAAIGGIILLAGGSPLLPIDDPTKTASFQIVVPVLVAQLLIMYKFFSGPHNQVDDLATVKIEAWQVKLPPMLVALIVLLSIVTMATGNLLSASWTPGNEDFKSVLTFSVTILNATTVLVVERYFRSSPAAGASAPPAAGAPAPPAAGAPAPNASARDNG